MKKHFTFNLLLASLFFSFQFAHTRAASVYWVGGSGNWSDINHWATASGGNIQPNNLPSPADDVIFDMNSFGAPGQVVVMDLTQGYCHDIRWQGVLNNPDFDLEGNLQVFGSLYLDSSMRFYGGTNTNTPKLQFLSSQQGEEIDFAGVKYGVGATNALLEFSLEGTGSFDLIADLILEPNATFGVAMFRQLNGVLRTNDHDLTANDIGFGVSGNGFSDFGSSTIRANSLFLSSPLANFDSDSTSFHVGTLNSAAFICQELQAAMMLYSSPDTFIVDTLTVADPGTSLTNVIVLAHLRITADVSSLRFGYIDIQGDYNIANNTATYLTLGSSTGNTNTLHRLADTICLHNIWAGHVAATGGAVWNFGGASIDLGNNTGVNFVNCELLLSREERPTQAATTVWSPTVLHPGDYLEVRTGSFSHGEIQLFDLQGRKLVELLTDNSKLHRLQIPAIPAGQYIGVFQTETEVHHARVIVQ
jgi:hypothetical protein